MSGYDAFISYSHAADLELAPVVREGLQRLAKPWNRRRALSIFLDQASLEVSSELGSSLEDRIEDTRWLILFMSEESAQSKWVGEEIARWAESKSKDQMALVLTSGEVVWDESARDFDYARSTAVSDGMLGVYTGQDSEPLYYDLRWAKDVPIGESALNLDDLRFRDAIATIAAPIHGMPKDELEGKDIREFRRARRLKRAAITGLAVLTVVAVAAGIAAWIQRNSAIENELRATSTALASQSENRIGSEPDLAALLALESFRTRDTVDARGALLSVLGTPTHFVRRDAAHGAPVSAIARDSSGLVATADLGGTVRLWTIDADGRTEPVDGEIVVDGEVGSLAFGDGGSRLTVARDDGVVETWDVTSATPLLLATTQTPTDSTVLSRDGSLAAGFVPIDDDGVGVMVYDVVGDEPVRVAGLDLSSDDFDDVEETALAFSEDSSILALGIDDVVLWLPWTTTDEFEGVSLEELDVPDAESLALDIVSVGFVAGANRLAVGTDEGTIYLLELDPDEDLRITVASPAPTNETHAFDSFTVDLGSGGQARRLVSSHNNGEVKIWDVGGSSVVELYTLRGHDEEARAVAFTGPDTLASGSFDGDVIWWAAEPSARLGEAIVPAGSDVSHGSDVTDVEFIDDDLLASVDADEFLNTWDPDDGTLVEEFDVLGTTSIDAAGGRLARGGVDGSLEVDLVDGDTVALDTDGVHDGAAVTSVALSDDLTMVVSADELGTIAVWDVDGGELLTTVDAPADFETGAVVFASPEALWVGGAVSPDDGETESMALRVDPGSGAVLATARHNDDEVGHFVTSIALSPDGSTLATGGSDRRIFLWDTADVSTAAAELAAHVDTVAGLAFVDDNVLLAGDLDGRILMWDVSAGRPVGELLGPSDGVTSLVLNPAATMLVAGSEDDRVWVWDLTLDTWLTEACGLAGRNMTDTEWRRFLLPGDPVRHCSQFGPADRLVATYPTDDR